ncbi:hypothetical protein PQX77_021597 [Marasmius sp. AFHP31]|nr:hypothetical protein PQX77_021597 [Marasmius sp. AFHP31]
MPNESPSSGTGPKKFGTSIYGNRNATSNNSNVFNSYSHSNNRELPPAHLRNPQKAVSDEFHLKLFRAQVSRSLQIISLLPHSIPLKPEIPELGPIEETRCVLGPRGSWSGKSAVAQTICETLRRKSQLAASFFFSRNDTSQSTLDSFFPTPAHQLATTPAFRKAGLSSLINIDDAARQNLDGFQMNLEGQFQPLIFQPCNQVDTKEWNLLLPKIIVIDGFNERSGGSGTASASGAQETLLSIIHQATSAEPPLPLQFMIFSRPESTIRDYFQTQLSHESLDMRDFRAPADGDIRRYLMKEFANITNSRPEILVGGLWPGKEAIEKLVCKADGHFIYAVTAMKRITGSGSSLLDLRERLDIVLRAEERSSYPDLSDLEQLYHTILQPFTHIDLREQVLLPILQLIITPHPRRDIPMATPDGRSLHLLAALVDLDTDLCSAVLSQSRSVLHVPDDMESEDISILHASFSDFLGEARRSHEFHVQPLSTILYFDRFSCYLLSILSRKVYQHQRKERTTLADHRLELW